VVAGGAGGEQLVGEPAGVDAVDVEVAGAHGVVEPRVVVGAGALGDVPGVADEAVGGVVALRPMRVDRGGEDVERAGAVRAGERPQRGVVVRRLRLVGGHGGRGPFAGERVRSRRPRRT
jgi:hypothetical protein